MCDTAEQERKHTGSIKERKKSVAERILIMSRKEERINEIMEQQNMDWDAAELLLFDELSEMFPECDPEDRDALEMMFETSED